MCQNFIECYLRGFTLSDYSMIENQRKIILYIRFEFIRMFKGSHQYIKEILKNMHERPQVVIYIPQFCDTNTLKWI